ncbi:MULTISPECIES: hypothetical protein [unclassified Brachybacterium]|uniref:hypothetical protein n=1 Tax=unclassified Brachybacterium TaxID=2623841 RepID=UPI00360D1201
MSQPPQNGWGQPPSSDSHGQPSPDGGYGDYGQPSPNGGFGQEQPSDYGQPPQADYGQASADAPYGQASPNAGYGQDASFAPSFGGDSGEGFTPQGGEKKSGGAKVPIIICAGCAVLALLLVIVGGGIFLFTRDGGDEDTSGGGETTQEETTEEETSEEAATEEEPTEEETTEEETSAEETTEEESQGGSSGGAATKDDPAALGETVTIDDGDGGTIDVTLGEPNWDATDEVLEANSYNEEPAEGETYILVPITATYHGDDSLEPGFSILVEYVSDAGNSYSLTSAVAPKDSLDVGTLYDGGTGEWEVPLLVPEDQVEGGAFTVSSLLDFSGDPAWISAT